MWKIQLLILSIKKCNFPYPNWKGHVSFPDVFPPVSKGPKSQLLSSRKMCSLGWCQWIISACLCWQPWHRLSMHRIRVLPSPEKYEHQENKEVLKRHWRNGTALLTLPFSLYSWRNFSNTSLLGFSKGAPFQFQRWYYSKSKTSSLSDTLFSMIYGQSNLQWPSSPHLYLRSSSEDVGSCRGRYHSTEFSCQFWALVSPS